MSPPTAPKGERREEKDTKPSLHRGGKTQRAKNHNRRENKEKRKAYSGGKRGGGGGGLRETRRAEKGKDKNEQVSNKKSSKEG